MSAMADSGFFFLLDDFEGEFGILFLSFGGAQGEADRGTIAFFLL